MVVVNNSWVHGHHLCNLIKSNLTSINLSVLLYKMRVLIITYESQDFSRLNKMLYT